MSRVNYDRQRAVRDMIDAATVRIIEDDRAQFKKTPDGKKSHKLLTQADILELKASALRKEAKTFLPMNKIYRQGSDYSVTDSAMARLRTLEEMGKTFNAELVFVPSAKEYIFVQSFMQAIKAL